MESMRPRADGRLPVHGMPPRAKSINGTGSHRASRTRASGRGAWRSSEPFGDRVGQDDFSNVGRSRRRLRDDLSVRPHAERRSARGVVGQHVPYGIARAVFVVRTVVVMVMRGFRPMHQRVGDILSGTGKRTPASHAHGLPEHARKDEKKDETSHRERSIPAPQRPAAEEFRAFRRPHRAEGRRPGGPC